MARKTLRFANSGPAVKPNPPNVGDILQVNADREPEFVPAGGITAGTPWVTAMFVDPLTAVAPASQNGSANLPFAAAQDAADALTGSNRTVVIGPASSGGDVTTISNPITWYGFSPPYAEQFALGATQSRLGAYTATDPTMGNQVTTFINIYVQGVVDLSIADLCYLYAVGSRFDDTVNFYIGELIDSQFNSTITCTQILAENSQFNADITGDFLTFRNCQFGGALTITALNATFDDVSKRNAIQAGVLYVAGVGGNPMPVDSEDNSIYGDGIDGNLAPGFGAITLTRPTYYNNVGPFDPGDVINTAGFPLICLGLLDLRGAAAGSINLATGTGAVGANAAGQTLGAGGAGVSTWLPSPSSGTNGGKGGDAGNGAGANGVAAGATNTAGASTGSGGGDGGASGGAAGKGGTATAGKAMPRPPRPDFNPRPFGLTLVAGAPSTGGGGGGGNTDVGGGGGGAGSGSGMGEIWARGIARDATTDAAAISGIGFDGGLGGTAPVDGSGGGGGAGGHGSPLSIFYDWLLGPDGPQNFATLDGGVGGDAGAGANAQPDGVGGTGGPSGFFFALNVPLQSGTYGAVVAGSAGAGTVGGAGGVRVSGL